MKPRKKDKSGPSAAGKKTQHVARHGALHIPLDFEKAVEGLLNVKPKKKRPEK